MSRNLGKDQALAAISEAIVPSAGVAARSRLSAESVAADSLACPLPVTQWMSVINKLEIVASYRKQDGPVFSL
ncbi:MAG: hypothetical protein RJA35_368 [Actinomycetota bacterium]|jgi:hypothetical protein